MKTLVGVTGGKHVLPPEFPETINGNSGDLVHTAAPLSIIPNSIYSTDPHFKFTGARSFREFINDHASHLIIVLANVLISGIEDGTRYARILNGLQQYNKPIVVFGLGVQAPTTNVDEVTLPKEAIELMQFLSSRANLLGVRGEFTKRVLEELCGVENAYVTGCPSLFSRPEGIRRLLERHRSNELFDAPGRPAVNVTNLQRFDERALLSNGIIANNYLIEPVSRAGYLYHRNLQAGKSMQPPYYFKSILKEHEGKLDTEQVAEFYRQSYRYFRHLAPWLEFNEEHLSWSYGTRFHVNMATLLSGKPAVWVTHDSRTSELTSYMHLPSVALAEAAHLPPDSIKQLANFDDFFSNIPGLFSRFSYYLTENGLPGVSSPI